MPTKTRMLDNGNFVYSPEAPKTQAFLEYLDLVDRLMSESGSGPDVWAGSAFSSELERRQEELDQVVSGFVDSFRSRYTIRSVKQDPTFLPVSRLFARYRPLREPFSILHCNLATPLHTVHAFRDHGDLAELNAALNEDALLPWWQSGPHERPCYLFGECVWELKESEVGQSDEGLVLLFLEMAGKQQRNQEQVACRYASSTAMGDSRFIPEKVRGLVWRRSRGRCAKCGKREGLEFDFIRPAKRGGLATPENLQLLCSRCLDEKSPVV